MLFYQSSKYAKKGFLTAVKSFIVQDHGFPFQFLKTANLMYGMLIFSDTINLFQTAFLRQKKRERKCLDKKGLFNVTTKYVCVEQILFCWICKYCVSGFKLFTSHVDKY
jgi:hypothetical protein